MSESRTVRDMFDRRLRFTNISESDGGEYQCIAENTQGKASHTYMVTVEGVSHSLSCTNTQTRINMETKLNVINKDERPQILLLFPLDILKFIVHIDHTLTSYHHYIVNYYNTFILKLKMKF